MKIAPNIPDQCWKVVSEIARYDEVENYLILEIFKALGLASENHRWAWLKPVFGHIVRGFAHKAVAFDDSVARYGFQDATRNWLNQWVSGINLHGTEQIPTVGPVLIAANHPGMYDGLAVASAIPRQDLKIIAAGNPFFRSLPNTRKHFIFSTLDTHVRMITIRNTIRHLQAGGMIVIFPSGRVDPDPFYFKLEARKAVLRWSESLELILRKAPQTRLVIAINSGFVAPEYLFHPILRLHPNDERRQKIAEVIQIIQQVVYDKTLRHKPRVDFSEPVSYNVLSSSIGGFRAQIMDRAFGLIEMVSSG